MGGSRGNKKNCIKLEDGPYDYSDALLTGHGAVEKDVAAFNAQ